MKDYKWELVYSKADRMYTLRGYELVGDRWVQHGAPTAWSSIDAPIEHIAKSERSGWRMLQAVD